MIRKISAHLIWPVCSAPIKFGLLTCTPEGKILQVSHPPEGPFREYQSLEFYDGLILPGFVSFDPGESQQSIFQKIKIRSHSEPNLNLADMLRCHTLEMAGKLSQQASLGSFQPGNLPGINLISGMNLADFSLTPASTLRILIPR